MARPAEATGVRWTARPGKAGWRALGVFWGVVLLVLIGGAAVLQLLGPPPRPTPPPRIAAVRPAPTPPSAAAAPGAASPAANVAAASPGAASPGAATPGAAPATPPVVEQRREAPPPDQPGRDTPGPIADPVPALLEPAPNAPLDLLPRIAADGRMPMQVYAAGFDRSSRRPRVGLLLAGIGPNEAESNAAVHDLPGGVTFAISPSAPHLQQLLTATRLAEHEYLVSIPMEPQGYPLNDPGPRALMTNLGARENMARLDWVLSQVGGYVGVTNAFGVLRGERFSGAADQMDPVLAAVARRGLLYVNAQPAEAAGVSPVRRAWSRTVDLVVDEPPEKIDQNLAELERIARDKGSALGLAGAPRPVVVQRIAAWANGLLNRGVILAPVSALAVPPAKAASAK